jgi:hypothetical protein
MAKFSLAELRSLAASVGFPDPRTAAAIAKAESGGNPDANPHNGPTKGCPNGSNDRGLWQINDCYHLEVSDDCAFDPFCNAQAAYAISSGGKDWSPWSTWWADAKNRTGPGEGVFLKYMGGPYVPGVLPSGFGIFGYGIIAAAGVAMGYGMFRMYEEGPRVVQYHRRRHARMNANPMEMYIEARSIKRATTPETVLDDLRSIFKHGGYAASVVQNGRVVAVAHKRGGQVTLRWV